MAPRKRKKPKTTARPPQKAKPQENLRWLAGLMYETDPERRSLADLLKDKRLEGMVHLGVLERWSADDQWVARRHQYWDQVGADVRRQLGNQMVRDRIDRLQNLGRAMRELEDVAVTGRQLVPVLGEDGKPKMGADGKPVTEERQVFYRSREQVVHALVRLSQHVDQIQADTLGVLLPQAGPEAAGALVGDLPETMNARMTPDEALAAAMAVLQLRSKRKVINASLTDDVEGDDADDEEG